MAGVDSFAEPERRQAETLAALFRTAERRQREYQAKSPGPSQLALQSAQAMARHLAISPERMQVLAPQMPFWQLFLPAAMSTDPRLFAEARERVPQSFRTIRDALAPLESHRQVVIAAFHMTGMPLIGALVGAAWQDLSGRPLHVLLARQNVKWLSVSSGQWIHCFGQPIGSDPSGLRDLITGLRNGGIERLLILVDGPHRPGRGTRALDTSPSLAFKTGLLTRILSLGIPIRPLTHDWRADRLIVEAHPVLRAADGVETVAVLIEGLLDRHPEQWLNWAAASVRT